MEEKNMDDLLEEWNSFNQAYLQNQSDESVFGHTLEGSKPDTDLVKDLENVLYDIESRYRKGERPVKNGALLLECMRDEWDEE